MFPTDRTALRQLYFDTYQKGLQKHSMTDLEQQLWQVIQEHPEYHSDIQDAHAQGDADYSVEMGQANPFLHMGLHLGIREQVATNRPAGIQSIYQRLFLKLKDPLEAEHLMMDQLAQSIWSAQRNQTIPDEADYLQNLEQLCE